MDALAKPKVTPKDFFLWVGSMAALYVLIFSFINLLFEYIDYAFPDALSYAPTAYSGAMPFDMAALVVLFPLFLVLMWLIRSDALTDPEKRELWVRHWITVITIFLAGAAAAIDLIILVSNFFSGDLTLAFVLKIAVVFLVAGAAFLHNLAYLKGYWESHRAEVVMVGWASGVVIACALVTGFLIMGAPWDVRLYRFDDQKASDLQSIQWQVVDYWQAKGQLPGALTDLNDPISNFTVPVDPQTGVAYGYQVLKGTSFELCAAFNADTQNDSSSVTVPVSAPVPMGGVSAGSAISDTWMHAAGQYCFLRTIDPARYPVVKK